MIVFKARWTLPGEAVRDALDLIGRRAWEECAVLLLVVECTFSAAAARLHASKFRVDVVGARCWLAVSKCEVEE